MVVDQVTELAAAAADSACTATVHRLPFSAGPQPGTARLHAFLQQPAQGQDDWPQDPEDAAPDQLVRHGHHSEVSPQRKQAKAYRAELNS